jgi:hypothetical protein
VIYNGFLTGGLWFTDDFNQLKMCLVGAEYPNIEIAIYSDSFDLRTFTNLSGYIVDEFQSLETATGLILEEFISNISIPRRCTNVYSSD